MRERPFFFGPADRPLFGVLHEPPGASAGAVVFCHPFGEEKLWTHRVFVSFARALAASGHTVLRFDYPGNGDSAGDFAASTIDSALAGLATAIEVVKTESQRSRVALVGLRLGATLAARCADSRDDVEKMVLWAPIVDGRRYAQELLRINLATQMAVHREVRHDRAKLIELMRAGETVNVDGYPLSLRHYEELCALKLDTAAHSFTGPSLIVHVARQAGEPIPAELERVKAGYAGATLTAAVEDPFWKEIERFYDVAPNLFAATLQWFEEAGA